MSRPARRLAVVALGVAAATAGLAAWRLNEALSRPHAGFSGEVIIDYRPGTSTRELAARLEAAGVVSSRYLFLLLRAARRDEALQAGEYLFDRPVSARAVFDRFASGRVHLRPLTIPEGLTRFEVADLIAQAGYGERDEFLRLTAEPAPIRDLFPEARTLEGCLFPDTYLLPRDADARTLVDLMTTRFRAAFDEARRGSTVELTAYEGVILASMIEKETGVGAERELVSSVFHNRLERRMLLQCDPTIIYGLLLEDRYSGRIGAADIADPHEYNTYVHAGLPPGPIAGPGFASLRAAFHPAETDYLYFVAESRATTNHVFSKTLEAHNRAVADYRESRGSR